MPQPSNNENELSDQNSYSNEYDNESDIENGDVGTTMDNPL